MTTEQAVTRMMRISNKQSILISNRSFNEIQLSRVVRGNAAFLFRFSIGFDTVTATRWRGIKKLATFAELVGENMIW
jgi:hypothetical protein